MNPHIVSLIARLKSGDLKLGELKSMIAKAKGNGSPLEENGPVAVREFEKFVNSKR